MSKILSVFFAICKIRYVINRPKIKEILLIDKLSEELLFNSIFKKRYEILHSKKYQINLFILFKSIFKLNLLSFHENYTYEYIRQVKPKIVISFKDNDIFFYKLKNIFKNIKFVSVQNGFRHKNETFFNSLYEEKKKKIKLAVDYYFLFGRNNVNKLKQFIKFTPKILGSFRNNKVSLSNKRSKKNSVLFVSNFRLKKVKFDKRGYNVEKRILSSVKDFCNKYKLYLNIAGSTITYQSSEKDYLISDLKKDNLKYIVKRNNLRAAYDLVDKHDLIIFIDSTLGYESIARKKKIASFSCRKKDNNLIRPFGFPNTKKFNNFFYSHSDTKKEVFRVLKNTFFISNKKWVKYYFPELRDLISYNQNNKLFYKTIKNILKS